MSGVRRRVPEIPFTVRDATGRVHPRINGSTMPEFNPRIIWVLALLGLAALGWVYFRRRQLRLAVREQFTAFRERAVVLMDQLDSLRQRHKTMTSTDPDFEVPMAGATRQFYEQVNGE